VLQVDGGLQTLAECGLQTLAECGRVVFVGVFARPDLAAVQVQSQEEFRMRQSREALAPVGPIWLWPSFKLEEPSHSCSIVCAWSSSRPFLCKFQCSTAAFRKSGITAASPLVPSALSEERGNYIMNLEVCNVGHNALVDGKKNVQAIQVPAAT